MNTRPIYCRKPQHIHAHFLICFVALTLVKLLERKYLPSITAPELFDLLRGTNYIKLPTGDWMVGNVSKNAIEAFKKMKFYDLLFQYVSNNTCSKIITYSKQK